MKTHTGGYWALRSWGLRGGQGEIAWFVGPELDRAMVLVEKWAIGEGDNPPICPPDLMRSWPKSVADLRVNPLIEMIDGTQIQVKHTQRQGKNLTARGVTFVWWTEAATTNSVMDFVRLRGRGVQKRGQIYVDAVPEAHNWVQTAIVEAAAAEAEELANGADYRTTYNVVRLSQEGNPWVDLEEAIAFRRDLDRIDPRIAAREAGGEFVPDTELLLGDVFDAARHTVSPPDGIDVLSHLGLEDITEQASLRWFVRSHRYIIALDVNANPHTALIGKIAVRKGSTPFVPGNWIGVWTDCLQVWKSDSDVASQRLTEYRNGEYTGAGLIMDATSMLARHNAGGQLNAKRRIRPREVYEAKGFEVRGPQRQKHRASDFCNPESAESASVVKDLFRHDRLFLDRRTCGPVIYALRNQLAEHDGITPKRASNTASDRHVVAFTDVGRYWAWPFFGIAPATSQGASPQIVTYG